MRFVLFVPCILAQEIEGTTTTTPLDTTTTGKSRILVFQTKLSILALFTEFQLSKNHNIRQVSELFRQN